MDDLIEILKQELTPGEIVELLSDILIHTDKNILENKLEEYAIDNEICPKCYSDLTLYEWEESRGEYMGFPASEKLAEWRCNSCGWS